RDWSSDVCSPGHPPPGIAERHRARAAPAPDREDAPLQGRRHLRLPDREIPRHDDGHEERADEGGDEPHGQCPADGEEQIAREERDRGAREDTVDSAAWTAPDAHQDATGDGAGAERALHAREGERVAYGRREDHRIQMSSANVDIAVPIWDTSWRVQTTRNVRTAARTMRKR